MDLDSVTDELFGVGLGDFTRIRNERSKQARADGDRELAQQIQELRKPTTSAWLVNQLSRHTDDLEPLLELGRELREAGALLSGDDLRALTRQRHQVVHALVQVARRFGRDQGLKVGDAVLNEVRETLEASLADPEAAEAVLAGRLVRPLQQVGFGVTETAPREARPEPPSRPEADVADLESRRRERLERMLHQAERALEQATSSLQRAQQDQDAAGESRRAADAEVERLRAELGRAEQAVTAAADEVHAKQERVLAAEQKVQDAQRAVDRARTDLDDLS